LISGTDKSGVQKQFKENRWSNKFVKAYLELFYLFSKLLFASLKPAYCSSLTTNYADYTKLFVKSALFEVLENNIFLFVIK